MSLGLSSSAVMEEEMEDGSNMLVMPGSRKKKAPRKTQPAATKTSKSMQRKLKRLEEEKEKKKLRKQALGTLAEHKLADGADQLMLSSSTLGKAKTMREKLRWGLQLERAGLPVPSDIPLRREKPPLEEDPDELDLHGEDVDIVKRKCEAASKPDAKRQKKELLAQAKTVNTDLALPSDESTRPKDPVFATDAKSKKPKQTQAMTCNNTGLFDNAKRFVIRVARTEDIEEQRSNLPVVMMEQEIMEAVNENDVVIICGETGSGKTTQVPQFLYEAGYGSPLVKDRSGMIGVTQPRRIAVLTTAKRVAFEMNLQLGKEVGFQVRHDRRIGGKSCIKFMTDGILLREIQSDFLLRKYSVIVLDEAHERSVNTDILVGMLSRVVPMRKKLYEECVNKKKNKADDVTPLKLIVMSATLRVEDFTANYKLFPTPPPVVNVAARQFPVTIHSSRKTELLDYQGAAYKKVCAIHRKLPLGGILVFMTGRREVEALCRRLRSAFSADGKSAKAAPAAAKGSEDQDKSLVSGSEFGSLDIGTLQNAVDLEEDGEESDFDYDKALEQEEDDTSGSESEVSDIEETDQRDSSQGGKGAPTLKGKKPGPLHVLPLYAMLPAAAQLRVFAAVPEGRRLVVVATNVAETSVTIPGIRYVVDCGRAKERKFSGSSGLSKFEISWISKASADQRAGRAGRTGPGHCYQLYSRTHYHNNFPDFSPPEISLIPIEGVTLVLKCMGIDKVMQFPFPTPPEQSALADAEKCLLALGALDRATNKPTATGKSMSLYPVNPRHARMLIEALEWADSRSGKTMRKQVIVACAVAMAAALSVDNPFLDDGDKEDNPKQTSDDKDNDNKQQLKQLGPRAAHARFLNPSSDALTVVNALSAYEQSKKPCEFCKENYLNEKIMKEMGQLRRQLSRIVCQFEMDKDNKDAAVRHEEAWKQFSQSKLKPAEEAVLLRALCAGWPDRIAKRLKARDKLNWQTNSKRGIRYQASSFDETVFLRPSSSTFKFASDFVVYKEIVQTATRPYMSCVALVDASCLVSKASYFCTFSKPLDDPAPFYDSEKDQVMCWASVTFGPYLWQLPLQSLPMKAGKQRTGTFAFALMAGKVFPGFVKLRPLLAMEPSMLLRPEAVAHKRVGDLVYRLESSGVDCRSKLAEMWKQDPGFLYAEVLAWLQKKHQRQLELIWNAVKATGMC